MCNLCDIRLSGNEKSHKFVFANHAAKGWPKTHYKLLGEVAVSVCDECVNERFTRRWRGIILGRRIATILILIWLPTFVRTGFGTPIDSRIINFFVMPGGLIIADFALYFFASSKKMAKAVSLDEALKSAAEKVIAQKFSHLRQGDSANQLIWTIEKWKKVTGKLPAQIVSMEN